MCFLKGAVCSFCQDVVAKFRIAIPLHFAKHNAPSKFFFLITEFKPDFNCVFPGIPLMVVIIIIAVDKNNYGQVTYGRYRDGTTDDL